MDTYVAVSSESDGKLRAAFDFDHLQAGQRFDFAGCFAAVRAAATKFAILQRKKKETFKHRKSYERALQASIILHRRRPMTKLSRRPSPPAFEHRLIRTPRPSLDSLFSNLFIYRLIKPYFNSNQQ